MRSLYLPSSPRSAAKATCRSVVPVEPCWWPSGGDFLADPQEHDLEPVGIAHCYAVDFRLAMPVIRHLLSGQEFLGAVRFGGIPRTPEDARYPASPVLCRAAVPISRITSESAGTRWLCNTASAPSFHIIPNASMSR